jgi:hypothetical protein
MLHMEMITKCFMPYMTVITICTVPLHAICSSLHSCLGYIAPYVTMTTVRRDSECYVQHVFNIAVKITRMCKEYFKWQTACYNNK